MKKTIGFILGFVLGFMILEAMFSEMGRSPRGAGWLIIPIVFGSLGAKFLTSYNEITSSVKGRWWSLDKNLRLVILISLMWIVGYYMLSDAYDSSKKIAFIPPILLFVFFFGNKFLVKNSNEK
jgi:hypothetical protein